MAGELAFHGKVAVVTGGGRGIGKHVAYELARRGAKVVVNDLGCSVHGEGSSTVPADRVVASIKQSGGTAVADYSSVTEGDAIIWTALQNFGRVDILINNAGIIRDRSFLKMSEEEWEDVYKATLKGTFSCCKAAWATMRKQRYGRIVNFSSASGIYGNFGQANYSAMKLGIVGLSNTLSREGSKYNIQVTTVAPVAATRMTATVLPDDLFETLKPQYVVPSIIYLCHESCSETGSLFEMGAGWVGKLRFQRTCGAFFQASEGLNAEQIADQWGEITQWKNSTNPTTTQEAFEPVLRTISSPTKFPLKPKRRSLRAQAVFDAIESVLHSQGERLVQEVGGVIEFQIKPDHCFVVDLKEGRGAVLRGKTCNPDLCITLSDDDFMLLATGKMKAQQAFAKGKLKVKGNMGMALKLEPVYVAARKAAKL